MRAPSWRPKGWRRQSPTGPVLVRGLSSRSEGDTSHTIHQRTVRRRGDRGPGTRAGRKKTKEGTTCEGSEMDHPFPSPSSPPTPPTTSLEHR